jgi:hypothetical protein
LVAGKAHADGDLGVDPRRVDRMTWALPGDIREVTPIDLRWCAGLWDLGPSALAIRGALSSSCANPLPLGGDGLLEPRVRDVEAVLYRQFDAHSLEPLVPANGEGAPLLGTQLERGENAFSPVAVIDVDLPTSVREGGRATLADAAIVDAPTFDERGESPNVLGCRALEGWPLNARWPSFSMSPRLRELVTLFMKPFFVAREPSPILVQYPAL